MPGTSVVTRRSFTGFSLAGPLFALTLTACSGGGGGEDTSSPAIAEGNGPSVITVTTDPQAGESPTSLTAKSSFSDDDLRHFLARTHFGVVAGKADEITNSGLDAYIDQMMTIPQSTQAFETDAAVLLADESDPAGLEGMFPSSSDIVAWNVQLMIDNPNAFQEVLGMFWQDYFGVDAGLLGSSERHLMVDYINYLRRNGVGSFRDLFLDVSRHGAMLIFLNGANNNKFAPNENYAREFWELFSLGVDNGYTEADIIEGSRAFTGWRRSFDAETGLTHLIFDPETKAVGSKFPLSTVVGHSLDQDDYEQMVELTLSHRDDAGRDLVAEYLAAKLLRYFVSDNPSDELIGALAAELRFNDLHIGATLKTLFLSEAFYATEHRETMVRDFYEQAIGLIRTTGMTESHWIYRRYLGNMDSMPSQPPSVEGWPEGANKITAQSSGVEMPNFVNELLTNRNNQEEQGYDIAASLQPADANGPEPVVDYLAQLLGVVLDDTDRAMMIDFMNVHFGNDGEQTPLNYTPQNTDHQSRKLRNLLWIMTQHPTFHTK
jgi:uncharacterized protein (DUF1800 family)